MRLFLSLFNSFNAEKPSFKARKERPDDRSTKFVLSERKETTGVKTDEFSIKNTSSEAYLSREEEDARDDDECTSLLVALRLLSLLYTFIEADNKVS